MDKRSLNRRNFVGIASATLAVELSRPSDLHLPMDVPVGDAGAILKCGECASKQVLTYPESSRTRGRA
jgi:hypothetical protein